jgi:hypothetical protein
VSIITQRYWALETIVSITLRTIYHLSSNQQTHQTALLPLTDPSSFGHELTTVDHFPIEVYTYPNVPHSPPFPFMLRPPAFAVAGETIDVDPYIRSAHSLSHSRTLAILKRNLGPHFDLEKLWEAHTYHVSKHYVYRFI